MDHHGKRSRVLFAASTRSQDRFGHSSRSVKDVLLFRARRHTSLRATGRRFLLSFRPGLSRKIRLASKSTCDQSFAGWRPAGPASRSGAHSRATHDHAKGTQGHKQRHATAGRCRLNARCERALRSPPPTPACRPALSVRTFSDGAISGVARAACGLASAARRTERHVNADRHMRASSRLDSARHAMSTHHARASSARMPRRRDGRLPCSKRAVSILQLWCNLNPCTSIRGLH